MNEITSYLSRGFVCPKCNDHYTTHEESSDAVTWKQSCDACCNCHWVDLHSK